MAKDGTNRGGRRVRAGDKPAALADKITNGKAATVLQTPLPNANILEAPDLVADSDLLGEDMPSPSEYLSTKQRDGKPLGADELYKETWVWLKERACEKFVNPRLLEAYAQAFSRYIQCEEAISTYGLLGKHPTTGRVVGGHQRLKILQDMGIGEVECVVVEMDEEKEKALNIALNKISGDWDKDKLALLITDLQGADFDVSLTGFDLGEIDDLFKDTLKDGIHDDDFDVDAELKKPAVSKQGDVWNLGRHRLICGDSTKAETFTILMDGKLANLVVTDPPYNVNYEGGAGKIKNDNMANDAFYSFLFAAFTNTEKAMADDASIYVFHADTEGLNFRKAFADAGFYLSGCCIWKKQSLVLGRSPYQWQHEPVLFGWKKKGKHQWYTGRKESTIWEFDKPKKSADHPTMKPVELLAYPILNSSLTNCIVLDPFGGSGSSLIACEQSDRICFMVELDEKYCDVIVKRYIEQVGNANDVVLMREGKEMKYREVAAQDDFDRF